MRNGISGVDVWYQPFIQASSQNDREQIDGYKSLTVGHAFGFDKANIFDNTAMGLAFVYANTEVDSENQNRTDSDVDAYSVSLYGGYAIDERAYLNFLLGYNYNDVETRRYDVGGVDDLDAAADYGTHHYNAYLELGHDFGWGGFGTLTPSLSATYNFVSSDTYMETGAGGAGLTVQTNDSHKLDLGVGLDAGWIFQQKSGSYLKPEISTKVTYDAIGDPVETRSHFNADDSASFTTTGSDPAAIAYNLRVKATYFSIDNWEISGGYDFAHKSDFMSHTGFMELAVRFRYFVDGASFGELEAIVSVEKQSVSQPVPEKVMSDMVGARGFEPPTPSSRTMCATRLRHAPTD